MNYYFESSLVKAKIMQIVCGVQVFSAAFHSGEHELQR